jgi:glycosyltransferase involved in cell wall biosynthesis
MRISLVAPRLVPGGVETFLFRLGRSLQSQGHEVEILLTLEEGSWFPQAKQWGVQTRCLPRADSFSPRAHIFRIANALRTSGCELCFLNHDRLAQAGLGLLPDNIIAVPIIHNDAPSIYKVACANRDAWNVSVGVSRKILRKASAMIGTRPIIGIPYGVDNPHLAAKRILKTSGEPLRLLFVGRLEHEHKGVLFLPMILAECSRRGVQCTLTIAGDGPDRVQLINDFRLSSSSNQVTMLGCIDNSRVFAEMQRADILLLPSFYEGLPIVVLEAMSNGCIPIASHLQGITDQAIVDRRSGFLVKVGDVGGFASVIEHLARRPELLLDMSHAAVTRFKDDFTIEGMAAGYSRLIADAAAGHFSLPGSRSGQIDQSLSTWLDLIPTRILDFCRGNKLLKQIATRQSVFIR